MSLIDFAMPAVRLLDPEMAHRLTVKVLSSGFGPRETSPAPPALSQTVLGLKFPHPVCLAAGFDKSAECWDGLLRIGAGAVEVGTLTPRPQIGNAKPRVFRLVEDRAVINRYGFNNDGMEAGAGRLAGRDRMRGVVGVNVGANKDAADPEADYATGVRLLAPLADYLTINISSPNTPGLRDLQAAGPLGRLIAGARAARDEVVPTNPPPLLVKIAPDLADGQLETIVGACIDLAVDGLIISNTTIARPETLRSSNRGQAGGLSGPPLFDASTALLAKAYRLAGGGLVLIGAGGVQDGATAYAKIRAGAHLVQVYTALVYKGPGLFRQIRDELAQLLHADGLDRIEDAVGLDANGFDRDR
jgi:dihydroorotate dehydrogenase